MIADGAACTLDGAPGTCMNGACELAFCGNGIREGLEDCDGDDLGPYDCTNAKPFVTFYDRPGLKCSPNCTYDFSSCTGYCGDGIVNGPEICDSSPPPETCLDFAFDVGALACIPELCAPDTSTCGYLGWTRMPLATSATLASVWASNPRDVYVVGGDGSVGVAFHYDGKTWTQLPLGASTTLSSVTGTSRDDVFVGQSDGKVAHWDGASWTNGTGLGTIPVRALRAIDATHVFAVGFVGAIAIWNGASWTTMTSGTSANLSAVWGTDPADVWVAVDSAVVGSAPPILHYDGSQWTTISNDNAPVGAALPGVSGVAGNVYFPVYGPQTNGGLLRWDGASFSYSPYTFSADNEFGAGAGRGDVFVAQLNAMAAVTPDGTSLTRVAVPSNSFLKAVGSDAMGHLWAVGTSGTVLRHRGTTWQATVQTPFPMVAPATYVWGTDVTHVFGVTGTQCLVYRGSGTWSANACASAALAGVWGTAATNVYAVGAAGTILQSTDGSGATWSAIASPTTQSLFAIWGSDAANIYAVGAMGTVLHSNGATWAPIAVPVVDDLAGIWGNDASHVFVVGAHGRLLRYDGSQWIAETIAAGADLFAVWGASPDDVWAVGAGGVISHFDGTAWSDGAAPMPLSLRALWGTARGDVFAAGDGGTVLHFDGNRWSPVRIQDVYGLGVGVGAAIHSIWGDGRYVIFGGQQQLLDRQAFPPGGCASHETLCNDAIDDDCDFLVDCDDPDCRGDAACQ